MSVIIKRIWNQNKMVNIESLHGMAFQAEDGGHVFEISGVNDAGEAVPLSGTVAGVFMRPDRADIALTGSASGGVVSVTLNEYCYAVPGRFGLTIFVTDGGKKTAVYAAVGTISTTEGGGVAGDTAASVVDLIDAISAAVSTIPASYSSFMGDVADTYSTTALYPVPVGAYAWYSGALKRCTVAGAAGETYTEAHWQDAIVGDDVTILHNALSLDNAVSVLALVPMTKGVANGVTYRWDGETMTMSGTSNSSGSGCNIWVRPTPYLPKGMSPGDVLDVRLSGMTSVIRYNMAFYNANDEVVGDDLYRQASYKITVPSTATHAKIRVWVNSNTATNTSVGIKILKAPTNKELDSRVSTLETDTAALDAETDLHSTYMGVEAWSSSASAPLGSVRDKSGELVRVMDTSVGGSATPTSFADEIMLPKLAMAQDTSLLPLFANHRSPYTYNGITYSWVDYKTIHIEGTASAASFYNLIISRQTLVPGIDPDDEILIKIKNNPDGVFLRVYKYENGSTTGTVIRDAKRDCFAKFTPTTTGMMFQFYVTNGTAITTGGVDVTLEVIAKPSIKHLRVLMIGNSYTNDCSAYSPLLIEELSKTTTITLGTTYYSGASIENYNDWFDNDSAVLTYYKYNALSGRYDSAATGRTIKQCLANEPWDIIVFQQASNLQGTWSSYATLGDLISKVLGYHASVHSNPVMLGFMFPQLRYSIIETTTFADVLNCVNNVMLHHPVSFWFPCGTAVENARATSLDSIGDAGHLCYDSNGHMQAGLPSLVPSYVTALKLLEIAGEPWHGILVDPIRPTAEWIAAINSPGENGTSTGVSYQNCLLAQKCAIAALKYPGTIYVGGQ